MSSIPTCAEHVKPKTLKSVVTALREERGIQSWEVRITGLSDMTLGRQFEGGTLP
jgi:hypothetical protein